MNGPLTKCRVGSIYGMVEPEAQGTAHIYTA